jgi:hypothetical protein
LRQSVSTAAASGRDPAFHGILDPADRFLTCRYDFRDRAANLPNQEDLFGHAHALLRSKASENLGAGPRPASRCDCPKTPDTQEG